MAERVRRREFRTRCPDGRWLSVEEAGPEDGELVVFHTGTPGSRYVFEGQARECAERGLRIACVARPGYSGSDRLEGRSYADNPADTALIADELGAETFYVIGHSGGGGPALADAAFLSERVRAATVIATFAPRSAQGLDWRAKVEKVNGAEEKAVLAGDAALQALLEDGVEEMLGVETVEQLLEKAAKIYSEVDLNCFVGEFLDFQLRPLPPPARRGPRFSDDPLLRRDPRRDDRTRRLRPSTSPDLRSQPPPALLK
jgi:pimeloyl-ACP methyl ester carboxylesterase